MRRPADYSSWVRKAYWRLNEAVALMLRIEPGQSLSASIDKQLYDDYQEMLDTARRSEGVDLTTLTRTNFPYPPEIYGPTYAKVNPKTFLKWAQAKGYDIPEELVPLLELDETEREQQEPVEERLDTRERTTLLQIIAVLAKEAHLILTKPYAAAETLQAMGAQHKVELPRKNDTIARKLKEAQDLSESQ